MSLDLAAARSSKGGIIAPHASVLDSLLIVALPKQQASQALQPSASPTHRPIMSRMPHSYRYGGGGGGGVPSGSTSGGSHG